ncbi:hypothetical protein [Paenibacillus gorillae]|uniref:hypothetical protein n=1 Tax=Paenibacillus gorillae TaxID=1243662 RepID=UPI0004BA8AE0|nr:hypothetical protein [Paenibacillus gorillae]
MAAASGSNLSYSDATLHYSEPASLICEDNFAVQLAVNAWFQFSEVNFAVGHGHAPT